ncbi:CoA transferase [Usitatibacter palustris]|uniref:Cinnamoyl-CoA:phenyllactate CoA-transferase n=1 Tax=Usitatibacter palustris TaxID=2732487 RepID=A0A6M4H5P5_9PROT|nr:CoA transferase [Usitatibacter palustris]QJR14971.1 Cinnamoyl-CoA:phenyllactate CoA-transferase [Usitatibacter palustris]
MASSLLAGLRVVSTALNLPGPAACSRLRDLGATVTKIEPPTGDPMAEYCPAWYARLHDNVSVHCLDLKDSGDRAKLDRLLLEADLFVTAQRPSALARLGLGAQVLAERFPRLCHVAITGHGPPDLDLAGHDLTYLASAGALVPPALPATLYADMAGAERAVTTALALVIARDRGRPAKAAHAPLAEAAEWLALPLAYGMTAPGSQLGGAHPGYNIYATKRGWIAVAALEPRFAKKLATELGLAEFTIDRLAERFATEDAEHWEAWARPRDLPIAVLRTPSPPES